MTGIETPASNLSNLNWGTLSAPRYLTEPKLMTDRNIAAGFMRETAHALETIGYRRGLLRERYAFSDLNRHGDPLSTIDLAGFADDPPSYRNACVGVTVNRLGDSDHIGRYHALGAPHLFALDTEVNLVQRWRILSSGSPQVIETFGRDKIRSIVLARQAEWNPNDTLRAKFVQPAEREAQLDLFDIGLVTAIDEVVYRRLDKVLRDAVSIGRSQHETNYKRPLSRDEYRGLFRLVFRFVAAKLLADRNHPGEWIHDDPLQVVNSVERFYFGDSERAPVIADSNVQAAVWERIRNSFHFQNLSVEALAFVYENTFITEEVRVSRGVHATPYPIADFVLSNLPIEQLPTESRYVFEPFCGSAPFLVAALSRLKRLLSVDIPVYERNAYLNEMLSGIEIDSFASEVARCALNLADYPNPSGWDVQTSDFFDLRGPNQRLQRSKIIVCNPPYEDFSAEEKSANASLGSSSKAVEALSRILDVRPVMIGIVLPRVFLQGQSYRAAKVRLASTYSNIDTVSLPPRIFQHSGSETILLMAHGDAKARRLWRSAEVNGTSYQEMVRTRSVNWVHALPMQYEHQNPPSFWTNPLESLWTALSDMERFGDVCDIHRGIEWLPGTRTEDREASAARPGFVRGISRVAGQFEPYFIGQIVYLNVSPPLMLYKAHELPWNMPKVIANAARIKSDRWVLGAVADMTGLVCTQRFHGIWPRRNWPVEVIAAFLNGPLANAYVSSHRSTSGDNQKRTIGQIPVPSLDRINVDAVVGLVNDYVRLRANYDTPRLNSNVSAIDLRSVLYQIDYEIMRAYELPAHLQDLLNRYLDGYARPIDPKPTTVTGQLLLGTLEDDRRAFLLKRYHSLLDIKFSGGLSPDTERELEGIATQLEESVSNSPEELIARERSDQLFNRQLQALEAVIEQLQEMKSSYAR